MQIVSTPQSIERQRRKATALQPNLSNYELKLDQIGDRLWITEQSLDYVFYLPGGLGMKIVVPAGFQTDLASVPRPLWPIFPPFGRYRAAAVVHDYLYVEQAIDGMPINRSLADEVFVRGMMELNVGIATRRTMWAGVRAGGWWPWWRRARKLKRQGKLIR